MGVPRNDSINMAVYEHNNQMMQLYVAKRDSIDLIEMQKNTKDEIFFKRTDGIYVMDNPLNETIAHSI
jgi:hypothetical protein